MTTAAETTRALTPREAVGEAVGALVGRLQAGYRKDRSEAVTALAQLRRGAGKVPAQVPELWGLTGTESFFTALPAPPRPDEAEAAELAMFLAITLYALHQQSRRETGMHRKGIELGQAIRAIMPHGAIDETLRRRFVQAGMATGVDVLAYRLRDIVTLLRRESQPLDYALLAQRLYQAQFPGGLEHVRRSWGRSFHAYKPEQGADDHEENQ